MTAAQVSLPLSGGDAFTTGVSITQTEYHHEIATVQLPDLQAGVHFIQGTPIHAMWRGVRGGLGEWYGYVDTLSQTVERTSQGSSAICVGMTYPLKEQRQDVWTNVTGDGVAETMAARWRLGADLDADERIWNNLAQAGQSDWRLLVQLARDTGFTLYSRGPLLCFHRRLREMVRLADAAPIFHYQAASTTNDILNFTPHASDSVNANMRAQLTTIDSGGQVMSVVNDYGSGTFLGDNDRLPNFTAVNTSTVQDATEADFIIQAQTENARFSIRATATLRGDSRLHPAMPIYLEGLPTQWNGSWFLHSVTHVITTQSGEQGQPDSYVCHVELGRDGLGDTNAIPTQSEVHHTDQAVAEIGPTGLWQCGIIPNPPEDEAPPSFVTERLIRNGV